MKRTQREAIENQLECPIAHAERLSGGDINDAFQVTLDDQRHVFAKVNAESPEAMFDLEARGLAWLAETTGVRVPKILGCNDEMLLLEYIAPGIPSPSSGADLGRMLATLHRSHCPHFGWRSDNYIGRLPQDNTPRTTWPEFYVRNRLEPQLRLAVDQGRASTRLAQRFAKLFARMEDFAGPTEPASKLHGDLWSGNALVNKHLEAVLIDPAVYAGHREIDLAMMRLFGGFSSHTFAAYDEVYPLSSGAEERTTLYQLYPLMVHVNLFGGGYGQSVETILQHWVG